MPDATVAEAIASLRGAVWGKPSRPYPLLILPLPPVASTRKFAL